MLFTIIYFYFEEKFVASVNGVVRQKLVFSDSFILLCQLTSNVQHRSIEKPHDTGLTDIRFECQVNTLIVRVSAPEILKWIKTMISKYE